MSAEPTPKFFFSPERAKRAVNFVERLCCHTQGEWSGQPFVLEPWQRQEIIEPLFGLVRPDGRRQHKVGYISMARKNGKSELGAAIALYLTFADGEMGGQVYSAAKDKAQASIVFDVAADMVEMSPILHRRATVVRSQKRIIDNQTRTVYRAISADAGSKHGFNASGVIFDELHTQPNRDLWDVLRTSMRARRQPLLLALTTAGYDRHSLCYQMYSYGQDILRGVKHDDSFFYFCREAPENADWQDRKVWSMANPALGKFLKIEDMEEECEHAQQMPSYQNTFRNLYLNQWVQQRTRAIDISKWDACKAVAPDLESLACYGALDLGETNDITSFTLVTPYDDGFYVEPHFWLPAEDLRGRVRRDAVPYDEWAERGLVTLCDGPVVDYRRVIADINALREQRQIKQIAFDRWGMLGVWNELTALGFDMIRFGQGFASMSAPTKELLSLIVTQRIHHDGNEMLRWMADCVETLTDPAGGIKFVKPDRRKNSQRIDGMVTTVMALALAMGEPVPDGDDSLPFLI